MSLFEIVLWVVLGVGVLAALWGVLSSGGAWREYAERGLTMERERPDADGGAAGPGGFGGGSRAGDADAEAREEIRQMLEAANARRARRGEPTVDIEAEIDRLTHAGAPAATDANAVDPEIEAEVRSLVERRNRRRVRNGEQPLDVEAEVARRLAELGNS